jgi:hypothetical protein
MHIDWLRVAGQPITGRSHSLHQVGDRIQAGDKTLIVTSVRTIGVVDKQVPFILMKDPAYGGYGEEDG